MKFSLLIIIFFKLFLSQQIEIIQFGTIGANCASQSVRTFHNLTYDNCFNDATDKNCQSLINLCVITNYYSGNPLCNNLISNNKVNSSDI